MEDWETVCCPDFGCVLGVSSLWSWDVEEVGAVINPSLTDFIIEILTVYVMSHVDSHYLYVSQFLAFKSRLFYTSLSFSNCRTFALTFTPRCYFLSLFHTQTHTSVCYSIVFSRGSEGFFCVCADSQINFLTQVNENIHLPSISLPRQNVCISSI